MDEPKKRGGWLRHCGLTGLLLISPLMLYSGAYWAMCEPKVPGISMIGVGTGGATVTGSITFTLGPRPVYGFSHASVHSSIFQGVFSKVFAPAHAVDCWIRPKYWADSP
jgi:hypothetical protein